MTLGKRTEVLDVCKRKKMMNDVTLWMAVKHHDGLCTKPKP